MKRVVFLSSILLLLLIAGVVFAQGGGDSTDEEAEGEISFEIESEIGRALPRNIIYDPVQERYAVVDAYGRLTLVNANTYQTEHVLYESGSYNDLAFSNDGQWLALAIESRIELYNTETGELTADLVDLGAAIRIIGPMVFNRDDNLLLFNGIYPAPRSIRLTENDTVTVPWLWNLTAARDEGPSTFPQGREAWQYFDYRNGFAVGPDNRIVAALPGRLQVFDAYTLEQLFEIPTNRYEQDPLNVWFSLRDKSIYVRPVDTRNLLQVDTQEGVLVEIPLNEWLSPTDLELIGGIELSDQARVIGEPESRRSNDLMRALLGETYRRAFSQINPLTITLIDLIVPPAVTGENVTALLFVYDEQIERGQFVFSRSGIQQMVVNPNNDRMLVRQFIDGDERVVTYDLDTGEELNRFIPSLRSIGSYSRTRKNRVLAYDALGLTIVSDFQRVDADSNDLVAEDLRYSRRFDRFFFTEDSAAVVTMSGTEWRLWDVSTGQVIRREVVPTRGSIVATSSDGHRFLTRYNDNAGEGVEVIDLHQNTRRNVDFRRFAGRSIDLVMPDADWEQFFVIYTPNSWGPYYPGNEISMYDLEDGLLWFMAGDDLPPASNRQYGWVDDETVYVFGDGVPSDQPARVYGLTHDPTGLPTCAVEAFPDQIEEWVDLWEALVYYLRPDALGFLTELICQDLPETSEEISELLRPTSTPRPVTPTPIRIQGVPVCLTAKYPDRAQEYAETWAEITEGLSEQQIAETAELLCDGIGEIRLGVVGAEAQSLTMMIDANTGERASGAFTPIERIRRPIQPVQDEFFRTEERQLGQAILSPDEELVAASSLPGELVVYRMIRPYQSLLDDIAATAAANLEARNLIGVLPSPTPTYNLIGTPRPTLTPTMTLTPVPPPDERVPQEQFGEVVNLCPAETLYTIENPPAGYSPTGRLVAPAVGEDLWSIDPLTGRRGPDETIPLCGLGLECEFSPDRSWILATAPVSEQIYVVRPDGSDQRILFDEDDRWPPYINWTGANTLEYEVTITVRRNGRDVRVTALQRDILGVFPDPDPWIPQVAINQIPATIVDRQPGGPLLVAYTTFSTGTGPGYKYYLYNTETREYRNFATVTDARARQLTTRWHPLGDRLFYYYPPPSNRRPVWYQINIHDDEGWLLDEFTYGTWSNEGRFVAYHTDSRTQPIAVYDSQTGLTRTYCIPETGARYYEGAFTWSPDSSYVALQAPLPKDENVEGVGRHTLVVDIESGAIIDVTSGIGSLVDWSREFGGYQEGN